MPIKGAKSPSNKTAYKYLMEATGISKRDCKFYLHALTQWMADELVAGRMVNLHKFGTFSIRVKAARIVTWGIHSKLAGTKISIPARRYVRFKSSAHLKQALNPEKYSVVTEATAVETPTNP